MDERSSGGRLTAALDVAGLVAATAFAAAGVIRPSFVGAGGDSDDRFWAAASAVRTGAITLPLLAAVIAKKPLPPSLLRSAAFVQFGDSAIGIWRRNPGMAVAPGAMGLVHLRSASRLKGRP